MPGSINPKGLNHIGIPVVELEKAIEWYERVLGFEVLHRASAPGEEGDVKVAFLGLGDVVLEFYQPVGAEHAELASRRHGHIDHVALLVDDVEEMHRRLTAAGMDVLEKTPVFLPFWENGIKYFNILGPNGEKIEFVQRL